MTIFNRILLWNESYLQFIIICEKKKKKICAGIFLTSYWTLQLLWNNKKSRHLNAHSIEIIWWHHNRHRWVTPNASFTDARTSLTNVPRIIHQCLKYQRLVPSTAANNLSRVIKKCSDIASWSPAIAGQCSTAKCSEHCIAMRGTLIINARTLKTNELVLVFI